MQIDIQIKLLEDEKGFQAGINIIEILINALNRLTNPPETIASRNFRLSVPWRARARDMNHSETIEPGTTLEKAAKARDMNHSEIIEPRTTQKILDLNGNSIGKIEIGEQ